MSAQQWSIRVFEPSDGTTIGTTRYANERLARVAFEDACAHAREHGGGFDLELDGKYVARFAVQLPEKKEGR